MSDPEDLEESASPFARIVFLLLLLFLGLFAARPLIRIAGLYAFGLLALPHLYGFIALRSIRFSRPVLSLLVHQKQTFAVQLEVTNGLLPVLDLVVQDDPAGLLTLDSPDTRISLRPFERRTIAFRARAQRRGLHEVRNVRLFLTLPIVPDPALAARTVPAVIEAYPVPLRVLGGLTSGLTSGALVVANPVYEDLTRFRGMREYVPGDELRRINWKASARHGLLLTTEYEASISTPTIIVTDLRESRYPGRNRTQMVERVISTAATLALRAGRGNQEFATATLGFPAEASIGGKGIQHLRQAMTGFARAQLGGEDEALSDAIRRSRFRTSPGTRLLVVSPGLPDSDVEFMERSKRRGVRAVLFRVATGPSNRPRPQGHGLQFVAVSAIAPEVSGE